MAPAFQGLDRAAAPPAATAKTMLDIIDGRWWNVYIGGPYTGGKNWSPEVLRDYAAHGIDRFMLTYVGQQAGNDFKTGTLTAEQGRRDAREALAIAKRYGYTGDFPLCLDIEMSTFNFSPSKTTAYAKAWCAAVHKAGARPGIYANPAPLQAMAKAKVPAEFVWVASWVSTTAGKHDPHEVKAFPDDLWSGPGQRAWQYAGQIGKRAATVLELSVDINVADIGCLAPAPNGAAVAHTGPKRSRALKKGDRGPLVVRATHRLSVLRSKKTGAAYLDGPRSRFDAETEVALKAFQAEHGITASGRYGRETARALLKAVKRAKEKATHEPVKTGGGETKAEVATTSLPALVHDFQRLDAAADRAWQKIEAYGRRRARVLEREQDREAETDIGKVTERLAGIEKQLATLVELERQELELERQELDLEREELELERHELEPQGKELAATAPTSAAYEAAEGAYATAEGAAEPVAVLAPTAAATDGANGAGATVEKPRRSLSDLSDEELDKRIVVLDTLLERSRKQRIARHARTEKAIAELTGKPLVVVKPEKSGHKKAKTEGKTKDHVKAGVKEKKKHVEPTEPRRGVKALQRALNRFSEQYLGGLAPLEVDGKKGPETDKRIRTVKFYLGYGGAARRSTAVPARFLRRLQHPRSPRQSGPRMLARAAARRRKQRAHAKRLTSGPIEGTPEHIIDNIVLPIAQRCGINRTPAENDAANARHGATNTGGRSDHQGPGNVAWAADMSNGSSPTPEMDKLARALAQRFDIPWNGSGLVNAVHGGYRYQLIYRTMTGGNHYNHVHFGVRDV
jgi:peptidoglycan hydrolase-like protein with peptidoglycan-binding domain